jgi:hypothetical protein
MRARPKIISPLPVPTPAMCALPDPREPPPPHQPAKIANPAALLTLPLRAAHAAATSRPLPLPDATLPASPPPERHANSRTQPPPAPAEEKPQRLAYRQRRLALFAAYASAEPHITRETHPALWAAHVRTLGLPGPADLLADPANSPSPQERGKSDEDGAFALEAEALQAFAQRSVAAFYQSGQCMRSRSGRSWPTRLCWSRTHNTRATTRTLTRSPRTLAPRQPGLCLSVCSSPCLFTVYI